jgi:hypothetical protein
MAMRMPPSGGGAPRCSMPKSTITARKVDSITTGARVSSSIAT